MKNPCLIIIDVQEKLFPVIYEKKRLLNNILILIKGFQLFQLPIIVTEQVPEKLGSTIGPIRSLLDEINVINKSSFSCARDSRFMQKVSTLKKIDGIILVGIETHVCVYQTERDLIDRGYHVEVVADAAGARTKDNHRVALDRIQLNDGLLTTTEMLLFQLQGQAEGDRFRQLVKLIK